MVYKVYSGRVGGVFGDLITVEVDSSTGLPTLDMIGRLSGEVKEAGERVRVALKNNGISLPAMRITVNLSPADEHKSGAAFDLPIAVAILGVFGHIPGFKPEETLVIGELSLDGQIKRVRGILPIVIMARERGFKHVILPRENRREGMMIKGIDIVPVSDLAEAVSVLSAGDPGLFAAGREADGESNSTVTGDPDFCDIVGQENAKNAAMVAAAGFHHLLMTGPPGSGKSLIAKCIPGIMPSLSYEESLEISSIYSVAGLLNDKVPIISKRPFINPHHGASDSSFTGGGPNAGPGLVSLSHRGILFLDEMPEFKRDTLDMLRQPMEDGKITVSRTRHTYTYPAKFMLVGAMNPCPCGYYPDRNRCTCSDAMIARYLSKISGPIADRIDLCVEVARMDPDTIREGRNKGYGSEEMRERVMDAVNRQRTRYEKEPFKFNSFLPGALLDKYVPLGDSESDFLYAAYENMKLSMRSYNKIIKTARTVADLDGSEKVGIKHLAQAACYKFPEYIKA